jgi:chromosomal replication initiator protein
MSGSLAGHGMAVRAIQDAVCLHYNVTRALLLSARRARFIARPRQVAMWLCRDLTRHSTLQIGRWFGGRDHTTILHGVSVIARLMEVDPDLAADVAALRAGLATLTAPSITRPLTSGFCRDATT